MKIEKSVLIGITGGIAAYKMADLVRGLAKRGITVRVSMTATAEKFITPFTLETLSGKPVWTADWATQESPLIHLEESANYDLALIAPATANFISKMATGVADDMLSTLTLALPCPVYVAPAMNPRMYGNKAVQANIATLKERGINIIQPEDGKMACGETGEGRLPSVESLIEMIEQKLAVKHDLVSKHILVTTGRTEEPIDSVRYISNRSSGKMGIAIANAAKERGAVVTLIHGVVNAPLPDDCHCISTRTAEQMQDAVMNSYKEANIIIMAAAVADFRPATIFSSKVKKDKAKLNIQLTKNQDILQNLGKVKGNRTLIGFAAETDSCIENGQQKVMKKNADMICVNDVSRSDIGFDSDSNELTFIYSDGRTEQSGKHSKEQIAHLLLDKAVNLPCEVTSILQKEKPA